MKRPPDLKFDFPPDWTRDQCDNYGRRDSATWTLFALIPDDHLGTIEAIHSHIYMRRDEVLREYEQFGSYPLIARPR